VLFADRAGKGMIEELELNGPHRKIVAKKPFAYLAPRLELASCADPKEN